MADLRLTRDEKRAQTRDALIDAAARVFARQGFHGASLDEIADAAGFSKGAIYSNFDSKEDLFLQVLDHHDRQQQAALAEVLASVSTLEERLRSLGEWFDRTVEEERDWSLLTLEFSMYAARNPSLREALAAYHRESKQAVANLIERQAAELGFPLADDPIRLAQAVQALGTGISIYRLVDADAMAKDLFPMAVARLLRLEPPGPGSPD